MAHSSRSRPTAAREERVLHHVSLLVRTDEWVQVPDLPQLLDDFSFMAGPPRARAEPPIELLVQTRTAPRPVPSPAHILFRHGGLRGLVAGGEFYLTEDTSVFHVQADDGRATARLGSGFVGQPLLVRQRFWALGLLALLRARGLYALHAAALVNAAGGGVLLVGASGTGKSTLTIGLVRDGWRYLSDDTVLLRRRPHAIEALALRKPFSVHVDAASEYLDLPLGPEPPCTDGIRKRRVDVRSAYPAQYCPNCRPTTLLFPRLVPGGISALRPMSRTTALGRLLAQSGAELFDRRSLSSHLELLAQLVRQARSYELCAGGDLRGRPAILRELLADAGS